ncbi:MAG: hypothetical protein H6724_06155 [Sandaracinus sp.]|nr:hypothetical protein [Sandaracinus sp.]
MKPQAQLFPRLWVAAAALALVLPAGWALVRVAARDADPTAALGVRLGMTASDVRARAQLPEGGTWSTSTTEDGTLLLDWSHDDPTAFVRDARFEVHEGALVAVRASVRDASRLPGDRQIRSAEAVADARPHDDGTTRYRLVARNCPVHAREVAEILASP